MQVTLEAVDEHSLAERLISYDTSGPEGIQRAAEFVKGWLEARDLQVSEQMHNDLPVLVTEVGPPDAPCVVLHGHIDVVPAHPGQFEPRVEGDRLYGRGAYDMKGALGAMMCTVRDAAAQEHVRVRFMCVPDEEAEDVETRSTDALVAQGLAGSFAITGEPTDLLIGVQAKGVLALRLQLAGTAAHGSRPWLGDNAILKAVDAFRRIETLPFSRESSELFDRPSINLARIIGRRRLQQGARPLRDGRRHPLPARAGPARDPRPRSGRSRTSRWCAASQRAPATVSRRNPYVLALRDAVSRSIEGEALSIGRDGASDAISFLEAGVPAVEFGPIGGGHHGPEEWVSLRSLTRFRQALGDFVEGCRPGWSAAARRTCARSRAVASPDPSAPHAPAQALAFAAPWAASANRSASSAPATSGSSPRPASRSSAARSGASTSTPTRWLVCAAARCRSTSRAWRSCSRSIGTGCTSRPTSPRRSPHARLLFVAVGTPPTYSGDADLSAVNAVVDAIPASDHHALVMKSTVPCGTGRPSSASSPSRASPPCATSPAPSS